jgi:hypothetical protein
MRSSRTLPAVLGHHRGDFRPVQLSQVPRFIRWGRPVEAQVRNNPGQVLALAAAAPPRRVSTITV